MRYELAILSVLANSPGGRATLDEVRRAVETIMTSGGQTEQLKRFSALGDIDIFQSGLVLRDDAGLQITEAGLSLLDSLETPSGPPLDPSSALASPPLGLTDSRSNIREQGQIFLKLDRLRAFIAAKRQSILDIWRRYLARKTSAASNGRNERLTRNVGSAAFALLSAVLVVACVVTAIAFGQIQSLKSDIAALRRELLPAKERITRLEQIVKAKRDLEQEEEPQDKSDMEKNKPGGEIRSDQTTLNLSREEIQLIRDYIKPAPSAGPAAPAINVGDPVSGAMIPLPSQLTEKVPKLLGGKFTTRNGAIIIIKHDSHQADAVLPSQ